MTREEQKELWMEKVMHAANLLYELNGCCHWETIISRMQLDHMVAEQHRRLYSPTVLDQQTEQM